MEYNGEIIGGKIYNITFQKNKIIRGWLLLVTENNEEFIVRQNSNLLRLGNYHLKREIYKSNTPLKSFSVDYKEAEKEDKKKSNNNYIGRAIALVLYPIIRKTVPVEWLWGNSDQSFNFSIGIKNLLFFWLTIIVCLYFCSFYRKRNFLFKMMNNGFDVSFLGRINLINNSKYTKKVWTINNLVGLVLIICFTIIFLFIIPFLVQARLLSLLSFYIVKIILFNGKVWFVNNDVNYIMLESVS